MKERFKLIPAVYLLFREGDKILLLRRENSGYEDGNYSLVAGHADGGESLISAAAREAKEESGVVIDPKDLVLKVAMHRMAEDERMDFFFEPKKWSGEIKNMEPEKCSDLSWFDINNLPENTIPYIREVIECYKKGIFYSEFGW
ncbi:MAG: NUDIX domain-containing protein [Candidatus Paceibacterota bacterium]